MSKLLGKYANGNYRVAIYDDGTKVRYNNDNYMEAEFPESADLKITNMCDKGCYACHEQSGPHGVHGDLNNPLLDTLHPYTELAIGGGNPLEHPGLIEFLQKMKDKQVICNLTVNLEHFLKHYNELLSWSERKLIHGIGISVGRPVDEKERDLIAEFPNSVVHVIAGIVHNEVLDSLADADIRLLILGYKKVGRGIKYYEDNAVRIDQLIKILSDRLSYWRHRFKLISFDNLALTQLDVKSLVSPEEWEQSYMGDDGQYTMYIDLCKNEYAVASTMERHLIPENIKTIDELFALAKEEAQQAAERSTINAKTEATIRKLNADAEAYSIRTQAEADAYAAKTRAAAEAEGNEKISKSLTQELIDYTQANRWDGRLPAINGNNVTPIANAIDFIEK